MEEKRAFVFDTNFIIQKQNILEEAVSDLAEHFSVYVTQVSIDERISQICREEKEKFDNIQKLQEDYSKIVNITLKTSYDERCDKYKKGIQQKYESLFQNNIIPYSTDASTFADILHRAFYKQAPFCAAKDASDKGFKDTLMWLSILEYFHENGSNHILFISNDKGFKDNAEALIAEFQEKTGKILEIKDNSYYDKLIKTKPEIEKMKSPKLIPDISCLRDKVNFLLQELFWSECINIYGDEWKEERFTLYRKVDIEYMENFFENLQYFISEHIFDETIAAVEVFGLGDSIIKDRINIPISSLEKVLDLYNEIKNQYPDYVRQFYSASVNNMNQLYRPIEKILKDDELPF